MGKKHYGHSHHSHHHHHHHGHDSPWGHHLFSDDFLFGTCAKDVLTGSDKSEVIFGLRGDDEIAGGDGNDWVIGGRGNDHVDGGPGSDKVFGGKGNDVATYVVAENANGNAHGHGDFYDGGKGHDILHLILTQEEMANEDILADIEAYRSFLDNNAGGCDGHGKVFEFKSIDLVVRNFEEVVVEETGAPPTGANTAPVGADDTYAIDEDMVLTVNAQDGVLENASGKDTDADGDPLTAILVDGPKHGELQFNDDGSFTYTPEADYFGADSFIYKASDGTDASDPVNVAIEVNPINDAPRLKDPGNPPPDWQVAKGTTDTFDILDYYVPGPENESDQTLTLNLVGATAGSASIVGNEIQYAAPNVMMGATIVYRMVDDGDPEYFLAETIHVDIV